MEQDFKTPEDVTEFESKMAKSAKILPKKDEDKLDKAVKEKNGSPPSTENIYKRAWKIVYDRLPKWRQNEIDNQLKTGRLSDKDWDNDFVRQITDVAESDNPQSV
jgi:6-pyruvoyl-tetrahydropterin synthase